MIIDEYRMIDRRWRELMNPQYTMYEVGAFFLSHKMVVRRNKLRRKRGK